MGVPIGDPMEGPYGGVRMGFPYGGVPMGSPNCIPIGVPMGCPY